MARNIALTDASPVHRDNGEGQPICGSGAVATKPFKTSRRHISCNKCRGIVKDMDAKANAKAEAARVTEAIKADSVAIDTVPAQRIETVDYVVTVEEVTEVGSFTVTFEYNSQKILVENVNAPTWQQAIRKASDMLLATASRTQYWVVMSDAVREN